MNPLIELAKFTRDLLPYNEQLIRIGRQNFERADFETNYIVVDGLGPIQPLARGQKYDGTAEQMSYSVRQQKPCTMDFYGPGAYDNAERFQLLLRSQQSHDLQHDLGITVNAVNAITDVKALTGQQYGNRVQIELNMNYTVSADVDTLRIDTAQIEIISE